MEKFVHALHRFAVFTSAALVVVWPFSVMLTFWNGMPLSPLHFAVDVAFLVLAALLPLALLLWLGATSPFWRARATVENATVLPDDEDGEVKIAVRVRRGCPLFRHADYDAECVLGFCPTADGGALGFVSVEGTDHVTHAVAAAVTRIWIAFPEVSHVIADWQRGGRTSDDDELDAAGFAVAQHDGDVDILCAVRPGGRRMEKR